MILPKQLNAIWVIVLFSMIDEKVSEITIKVDKKRREKIEKRRER